MVNLQLFVWLPDLKASWKVNVQLMVSGADVARAWSLVFYGFSKNYALVLIWLYSNMAGLKLRKYSKDDIDNVFKLLRIAWIRKEFLDHQTSWPFWWSTSTCCHGACYCPVVLWTSLCGCKTSCIYACWKSPRKIHRVVSERQPT